MTRGTTAWKRPVTAAAACASIMAGQLRGAAPALADGFVAVREGGFTLDGRPFPGVNCYYVIQEGNSDAVFGPAHAITGGLAPPAPFPASTQGAAASCGESPGCP